MIWRGQPWIITTTGHQFSLQSLIPTEIRSICFIQHVCRATVGEGRAGISFNSSIIIITSKWQWSKGSGGDQTRSHGCLFGQWQRRFLLTSFVETWHWLACPVTFAFPPCGPCTSRPDGRWCLQSRRHTNTPANVPTYTHLHKLPHTYTQLTIKFPFTQQSGAKQQIDLSPKIIYKVLMECQKVNLGKSGCIMIGAG